MNTSPHPPFFYGWSHTQQGWCRYHWDTKHIFYQQTGTSICKLPRQDSGGAQEDISWPGHGDRKALCLVT